MEQTKQAIERYKTRVDGLADYFLIISKIEHNSGVNPDIAIESCNSLVEGLCKKSLSLVHEKYQTSKKLRDTCENSFTVLLDTTYGTLFQHFVEEKLIAELSSLISNITVAERLKKMSGKRIAENSIQAVKKISALRGKRGDICHGRIYPKDVESDIYLAKSVISITDGICSLIIHQLVQQLPEPEGEIREYDSEEMEPYNVWLDEGIEDFPIEKARYSEILYEKDYAAYQSIYEDEYLPSLELEEVEEEESVEPEVESETPELTPEPEVKDLTSDFDEESFWTPQAEEELREFADAKELEYEQLKQIVSDSIIFERYPRSDDLFKAYEGSLRRLKDWLIVKEEIINDLVPLIESLKSDAGIV